MPFNTRNPIPSGDLRDLDDNARNIDTWANDKTKLSHPDRFGVERYTWHGIEQKADAVVANLGFFPPVDYTAGLTVDSRNFTVTYNGVVYAAQPSAVPFTTGAWDAAQWYPIQNVLNQKNLLIFDTYAEASAAAATLPDGQIIKSRDDIYLAPAVYKVQAGTLSFEKWDFEGRPQVKWWGTDGAAINSCIRFCAHLGGSAYDLEPITYLTEETIEPRRGCVGYGTQGKTRIKLADGANIDLIRSYKFDELLADEAYEPSEHPDYTMDCGFVGVVIDGNRANQSTSDLIYTYKNYGRRPILKNTIITNSAGVGLLTISRGAHTSYDDEDAKAMVTIDQVEIMNCDLEHWINDGLTDVGIGTIVTNVCGDRGTLPVASKYFPGETVNSVTLTGYGSNVGTMVCQYLNLNGAVSGRLFVAKQNSRIDVDTLIGAGSWGSFLFESGCRGQIKTLHPQANVRNYGGVIRPYLENLSASMVFGATYIRRSLGDGGAPGVLDTAGGTYNEVISVQDSSMPGHLFVASGNGASVNRLKAVGISGAHASDGEVSSALVTSSACDNLHINVYFNNIQGRVWTNKKAGLIVTGSFTGLLGAGTGQFSDGVTSGAIISRNSMRKLNVQYRDSSNALKTSAFAGAVAFDCTTTGQKNVSIPHTLWRTPLQEDIQLSLRVSGFTVQPVISGIWLSSFDASSITARVTVDSAATGSAPVAYVLARAD